MFMKLLRKNKESIVINQSDINSVMIQTLSTCFDVSYNPTYFSGVISTPDSVHSLH